MADRVGQQLGNYRLLRLLGRGGFAEVYLGEHQRLNIQAAIKVLHTSLEDDDVEGFLREAQMVAHLRHSHIVRVLDFDVENHTPFLVMDYLPNGNVRRSHPFGMPLPLQTIVSYVTQVASALQYAHDEKLIHRDIKPENMLLDRDNTLVLSDFGIALMSQSSRHQSTQEVAGTAAYMAPEQLQGHPRRASDQYALAVVVYEWLTGDRPFHGSFSEIASQHLFVPPPPLREKVPTIPLEVEQQVLTALEKDPSKRFSSVKAFTTALEQAYQNTQASSELPRVPLPSSASVTESGEQTIQAERPLAERVPSPEQLAFQRPLQSLSSPETPSGSPAILSFPSLPPTTPAQSLFRPDESPTGRHIEREAPENLEKEPFLTRASGSYRTGGLMVAPREKLIRAISIAVASILLVAVLGNWIVSREQARTPTPTPVPAGVVIEFPVPTANSRLGSITAGPDGNLWFTELNGNKIGRISPSGTITEFPVSTAQISPDGIAAGPDGNLWFTEYSDNKIGRISPSGTITEFPVPTAQNTPDGITAGPDGNLWFTEDQWDNGNVTGSKIGRISPSGTITEFPIPTARSYPYRITAGPDRNLWFTETFASKIGRISPSGTITEFPVPTAKSYLEGITAGPDGNLWFTEVQLGSNGKVTGSKIGRISPSGTITEFPVPTTGSAPQGIAAGPDGNLWFTDSGGNKIGRISPSGTITEFPVPTTSDALDLEGITAGPDHNLWFVDSGDNKIGRISLGGR